MDQRALVERPSAVLALAEVVCPSMNGAASYRLAAALEAIDAGLDVGELDGFEVVAEALAGLDDERVRRWEEWRASHSARLVTVLDDAYPANLRMVHDHPPLLFVRGTVVAADVRAVAVVGTREPSAEGLQSARQIAASLVERGVTVVSGMAAGIDTAAHTAALDAGGRTLAVFGTGIERVFPAGNRRLSAAIASSGATLSQFLPDQGPTRWSFPVRNIVTSGLAIGTVVVEAGPTSGARRQAEHAIAHGKRLFLVRRLVEDQLWAQEMMATPGVVALDDIDQILTAIDLELATQTDVLV